MKTPRLGSCLSGIGGIDLGFHLAGWEIAWQVERDKYKQRVLQIMWPQVLRHPDLLALHPLDLPPVDAIAIDCPLHRYREDMALVGAALRLTEAWQPTFIVICLPCAVQFRDDGADWAPLLDALMVCGYHASSVQTSVGRGTFWWERTWLIGHRQPLRGRLTACVGLRQLFHDAVDQRERDRLCHGALDYGDFGMGEYNLAFPKRWTCICGDRTCSVPCTSEARESALRQATCVDVAAWLGKLLYEELQLLVGETLDVAER